MSAKRRLSPSETAREILDFFKSDILAESNDERRHLSLPEVEQFIYAIEGMGDCYKSETLVADAFRRGLSVEAIQRLVSDSGSSCIITGDEEFAHDYLRRCYEYGNTDMSLYDVHSRSAALLYVTWTNSPT